MKFELLQKIHQQRPMILNIANSVTQSDVANAISAIGASPLMTNYEQELKTLVQMADGVCVNIGTLDERQNKLSLELVELANQFNKPVVLDPVGIGAVPERLSFVEEILQNSRPTVIRGNASEIASLVGVSWQAKGIDSIDDEQTNNLDEIAIACASKFSCVTVITGEVDTIATNNEISHVANGNKMFTARVGTGDMLSAIIATFAAVSDNDYFEACKMASLTFSLSGEAIMRKNPGIGPAKFSVELIDKLYFVNEEELKKWGKYDE